MLASSWCSAATLVEEEGTTLVTVGRAATNEKWKEYAGLFNHLIIPFKRHLKDRKRLKIPEIKLCDRLGCSFTEV